MTPDNATLRKWAEAAGFRAVPYGPDDPESRVIYNCPGLVDEEAMPWEWDQDDPALLPLIAERLMEKVLARDDSAVKVAFEHLYTITSDHIDLGYIPTAVLGQWLRATAAQRAAAAYAVLSSHEENADD